MSQKHLGIVIILICLQLLSGCGKSVIPAPIPTPSFVQIPIPKTPLKPKSIIRLTVTDVTGTISTRNQVAVTWRDKSSSSQDTDFYVGLLDIVDNKLRQSKPSIHFRYYSPSIVWSPDGTRLLLREDFNLTPYDILVFQIDGTKEPHYLFRGECCGVDCDWSPDGRYIVCNRPLAAHGQPPNWEVQDTTTWQIICPATPWHTPCPPLRLADGRWWHMGFWRTYTSESPEPTEPPQKQSIVSEVVPDAADQICEEHFKSTGCMRFANSTKNWVAILSKPGLYVLDIERRQVLKIAETDSIVLNWSVDGRYLAWLEDGQVRVFDTANRAVTAYTVPGIVMLRISWSPLQ